MKGRRLVTATFLESLTPKYLTTFLILSHLGVLSFAPSWEYSATEDLASEAMVEERNEFRVWVGWIKGPP